MAIEKKTIWLKFWLEKWLIFHFDSVTFFELFPSVGSVKPDFSG